jgi:hypothetical protein
LIFFFQGFSIEGPSQARIECNDNGDGSANVRYWPTIPGEYAVHILCNDEDIPLSPFMAWVESPGNFDSNKVRKKSEFVLLKRNLCFRLKLMVLDLNQQDKLLVNQLNSQWTPITLVMHHYTFKLLIKIINQLMFTYEIMVMVHILVVIHQEIRIVIVF